MNRPQSAIDEDGTMDGGGETRSRDNGASSEGSRGNGGESEAKSEGDGTKGLSDESRDLKSDGKSLKGDEWGEIRGGGIKGGDGGTSNLEDEGSGLRVDGSRRRGRSPAEGTSLDGVCTSFTMTKP